jgi:hypothetical protein
MAEMLLHTLRSIKVAMIFICISTPIFAQQPTQEGDGKPKPSFKDTLDGEFDFSSFLIDSKGFIPIPMIITEPALGDIGGVLALTFFTPKLPPPGKKYIAPDITAGVGMYTANGSWAAGGGRIGSFPKAGIKYRAFAGYASLNLSFYRNLPSGDEQEFKFNIEALPVMLNISKSIGQTDIYLGGQYVFSKTTVNPRFETELPDWVPPLDADNKTGTFSLFGEWDQRSNFFTPDQGTFLRLMYGSDDTWTGSDFDYRRYSGILNYFLTVRSRWISGFRMESQHVSGDPPFYLLPSLSMRGVPVARYQGATTILLETEQRFDIRNRWSVVAFVGGGKAIMKDESFDEAETVINYGAGFRYLIARIFGIRAGIDIARGPDNFAWYIVFGHNWNR